MEFEIGEILFENWLTPESHCHLDSDGPGVKI